ncbi:MAG: hypothetical protein IJ950_01520 [Helicobacter sp.]|nr:hypothetical protein [Helicobacter sp.]
MSVFILNVKKVSQDFGSVAKMARAYNISQPTLEHIIYRKSSLNFRKDSVREAVNELLAKGYLYYADEEANTQGEQSQTQRSPNEISQSLKRGKSNGRH